jgi:hypothetical protein
MSLNVSVVDVGVQRQRAESTTGAAAATFRGESEVHPAR